eukprot:92638-Rhodomonas_salina.1
MRRPIPRVDLLYPMRVSAVIEIQLFLSVPDRVRGSCYGTCSSRPSERMHRIHTSVDIQAVEMSSGDGCVCARG